MEKTTLIQQARAHILEGDTQAALDVLAPLQDRTVQLLTAQYRAIREQIIKDTLSFDQSQRETNKVNDQLLRHLEDLERGRVSTEPARKSSKRWWALGGLLLLLVLGGVYWLRATPQQDTACPKFSPEKGFKIVVFPFQRISGPDNQRPALKVMNQISELIGKRNIAAQAAMYQIPDSHTLSFDQIEDLAKGCNADLVIHGDFNVLGKDSLQLKLRYRFFQTDQTVGQSTTTNLPNAAAMDTWRSLDDVVFSICAQIAYRNGKKDLAKTWIQNIKQSEKADMADLMQ